MSSCRVCLRERASCHDPSESASTLHPRRALAATCIALARGAQSREAIAPRQPRSTLREPCTVRADGVCPDFALRRRRPFRDRHVSHAGGPETRTGAQNIPTQLAYCAHQVALPPRQRLETRSALVRSTLVGRRSVARQHAADVRRELSIARQCVVYQCRFLLQSGSSKWVEWRAALQHRRTTSRRSGRYSRVRLGTVRTPLAAQKGHGRERLPATAAGRVIFGLAKHERQHRQRFQGGDERTRRRGDGRQEGRFP